MNMTLPKMIMFDYGHTLVCEPDYNPVKGADAVLAKALRNPRGIGANELAELLTNLYNMCHRARKDCLELHHQMLSRFAYEYLGIEFDMPLEDVELVFWDAAAPGEAMQGISDALLYMRKNGIRTGVISNISFGGVNLKRRINSLLPDNDFEFFIASSEYMLRKPHTLLFELALRKAGLSSEDVWFCGDSPDFDAQGASSAGIFPVWYHSTKPCYYRSDDDLTTPPSQHLYIRDWGELVKQLSKLF